MYAKKIECESLSFSHRISAVGTENGCCECRSLPDYPSKMNTTQNKMIQAITSVLRTGIQDTPKNEYESNRMRHERIASLIAEEMKVQGLKNVDSWAVYEGDDKFSYTLRSGKYMMFVKQ